MKFNRQELLEKLAMTMPGIEKRELVAQMARFTFTGKDIITYNTEISIACPLETDFTCAIHAETLYKLLNKLTSEEVSLYEKGDELKVSTPSTKAGLSILQETQLDDVLARIHEEIASAKWKIVPKNMIEGMTMCRSATSKDPEAGNQTCLELKGDVITGGDRQRASRFTMEKKVYKPFMLQAAYVDDLKNFDVKKYYLTDSYIHFKTGDGTIFSCVKQGGTFLDYDPLFDGFKGVKFKVPEQLKTIIETVGIITDSEDISDKKIEITLAEDTLICHANTPEGWIRKTMKKVGYTKSKRQFIINPTLLLQALESTAYLFIAPTKILLKSGNFKHILGTMK